MRRIKSLLFYFFLNSSTLKHKVLSYAKYWCFHQRDSSVGFKKYQDRMGWGQTRWPQKRSPPPSLQPGAQFTPGQPSSAGPRRRACFPLPGRREALQGQKAWNPALRKNQPQHPHISGRWNKAGRFTKSQSMKVHFRSLGTYWSVSMYSIHIQISQHIPLP